MDMTHSHGTKMDMTHSHETRRIRMRHATLMMCFTWDINDVYHMGHVAVSVAVSVTLCDAVCAAAYSSRKYA